MYAIEADPFHSNLYRRLGLTPSATQDEIRRAYKLQARRFHPDFNPSADADQAMKNLNEAAGNGGILNDDNKRREYDEKIKLFDSKNQPPPPRQKSTHQKYHSYANWEDPNYQEAMAASYAESMRFVFETLRQGFTNWGKNTYSQNFNQRTSGPAYANTRYETAEMAESFYQEQYKEFVQNAESSGLCEIKSAAPRIEIEKARSIFLKFLSSTNAHRYFGPGDPMSLGYNGFIRFTFDCFRMSKPSSDDILVFSKFLHRENLEFKYELMEQALEDSTSIEEFMKIFIASHLSIEGGLELFRKRYSAKESYVQFIERLLNSRSSQAEDRFKIRIDQIFREYETPHPNPKNTTSCEVLLMMRKVSNIGLGIVTKAEEKILDLIKRTPGLIYVLKKSKRIWAEINEIFRKSARGDLRLWSLFGDKILEDPDALDHYYHYLKMNN